MPRVIGILNSHTAPDLGQITSNRALAALSFLGRYALCDIPLSNFSNSGIDSVGILVNRAPRSMLMHIDGKQFASNSKLGGCKILYNEKFANNPRYNTDVNNIIENKWFLDDSQSKYVIFAPSHLLYRLDFRKLIEFHEKSDSVATLVYKKINDGKTEFINHVVLDLDYDGKVLDLHKNKGLVDNVKVSMETLIINTDKLLSLIDVAKSTSTLFTISDTIKYICSSLKINTFEYTGYLRSIGSLSEYLNTSLELLDFNVLSELFSSDWPIYTKTHDTPPARYLRDAWVRNSFISNGAVVDGKVENSVLCREVKVGNNAIIRNSIIMSNTEIADNAVIEYCIIDKNAKVIHINQLKGDKDHPLYIGQGDVI